MTTIEKDFQSPKPKRGAVGRLVRRSFFALLEYRISCFRAAGQDSTADNYRCALDSFREFRGGEDCAPGQLTAALIGDFQKHMRRKGLSMNTISLYNRNLRAAYNYALDEELLGEDKRPFRKVFTGVEKTRKRAVREDVVRRIIDLDLSDDPSLDLARDIFLFCIYTQGMAFVDVAHLTAANLDQGLITYRRHKTGQPLAVELLPCARAILRKYQDRTGPSSFLLPLLYNADSGRAVKYSTALRQYNRRLRQISDRMGLDIPISSYVARHTWASVAKWSGVKETVISEAMGHNSTETTAIYLASLDSAVVGAANQTVVRKLLAR